MRLPRLMTALMAGGLLALAGTMVQRMTRNPMASPELLGISTGAALGMVVLVLAFDTQSRYAQILAGGLGGSLVLLALLALSRRSGFSPQRILLGGIALSALLVKIRMVLAMGDTQSVTLLNWLSGPRMAGQQDAWICWWFCRCCWFWHLLQPLAELLRWGCLCASAGSSVDYGTIGHAVAGGTYDCRRHPGGWPLSFVGLMAPHLARMIGFRRAMPQLLAAFYWAAC